jgi:hypothetical protein
MSPIRESPKTFVLEMMAEVEMGKTPTELGRFLRERFPRRWLSRLMGSPREDGYAVTRIVPFDDVAFFKRTSVFQVTVRSDLLEGHYLPSGGSFGLFAIGAAGFLYLNRNPKAVERLLREEGRLLNEADPTFLGRFFSEALLRRGNDSADIVNSVDELASYSGGVTSFAGQYEINASELNRVGPMLRMPSIIDDGPSGWHLEYCAVSGSMHDKTTLTQQLFKVDREFHLKREENVLSRTIFSKTPQVRY